MASEYGMQSDTGHIIREGKTLTVFLPSDAGTARWVVAYDGEGRPVPSRCVEVALRTTRDIDLRRPVGDDTLSAFSITDYTELKGDVSRHAILAFVEERRRAARRLAQKALAQQWGEVEGFEP